MGGFFKKISANQIAAPLKGITKTKGCYECKLYSKCHSPMLQPYGEGKKKILVIGSAPGEYSDDAGTPFTEPYVDDLEQLLYNTGIDLLEDCYCTYAVNCRPTNKKEEDRDPTNLEIAACRHKWKQAVGTLKPKKIILLGMTAVTSFLGERFNDLGSIERWVNWAIPDQTYTTWVFPTYDPNFVFNVSRNPAHSLNFTKQINNIGRHTQVFKKEKVHTTLLKEDDAILSYLEKLVEKPPRFLAFDYETSGLKPHKKGHFIRIVGVSHQPNYATAFPFLEKDRQFQKLWKKIMRGPSKKICQNWAMESKWTEEICGYTPKNPYLDTMLCSHVLDNRSHITGLKFQAYVRFGVSDYSQHLNPFLKANEKGGNNFNRVDDAPLNEILEYCAFDAGFTFKLFKQQSVELKTKKLTTPYFFFHDGMLACHRASQRGIHIDQRYFKRKQKMLQKEIADLEEQIRQSKEHKKWTKQMNCDLDLQSSNQVKKLIIDVLKLKTTKTTDKGNISVDKEVLEKLRKRHHVFDLLLTYRKKQKILNTYIDGFLREMVDGKIYSNINLHLARTYRSSVDAPNFQNIPKRDKEAKKLVRTGIIPEKGYKLMAIDYSGAEVRSGCLYHQDQQMIDYNIHGLGDMHQEYAGKLYLLPDPEITKDIRNQGGKSGFIFPQFYGDWYVANAKSLWQTAHELNTTSGTPLITHLKEQGYKTLSQYEQHVKEIERQFWEETFPEFNEYKRRAWDEYLEKGYLEMLTGFRCTGAMDRKNVVNYPFQGTAFHWLLWSMIQTDKKLLEEKYKSTIIMQIHDELLINVHPDEEEDVYHLAENIMTKKILGHWKWINVPLQIDAQVSKIDGNWAEMESVKY